MGWGRTVRSKRKQDVPSGGRRVCGIKDGLAKLRGRRVATEPWFRRSLALALIVNLFSGGVSGQEAIRGVVLDDTTGRIVPSATIRLFGPDGPVAERASDGDGRFEIPVPSPGIWQLQVERIGFRAARSQDLTLEMGEVLAVEFRILPSAVLLNPILVTGSTRRGREAFARREAEWGRGIFLSPEDIAAMDLRHAADVFRNQEKVRLGWHWERLSAGSGAVFPVVNSSLGRGCFNYLLNRVPVRLDPFVPSYNAWAHYQLEGLTPEDIKAVEIYRYPGEAPPDIRRYVNSSRVVFTRRGIKRVDLDLCGLIVIWTREGW